MTSKVGSLIFNPILICASLLCTKAPAAETVTAEAIVRTQLEAYNARNMEAFLATYTEDAELFVFPGTLQTKGKADMRKRYEGRFNDQILRATIVGHIVMGNTVIDHERIQVTLPEGPGVIEAIAIYEVRDGRIAKVTFMYGPRVPGAKL